MEQIALDRFRFWLGALPPRALIGRSRDPRCTPLVFFAEGHTQRQWCLSRSSSQLSHTQGAAMVLPVWAVSLVIASDARYDLLYPVYVLRLLRELEHPLSTRFEQFCTPLYFHDFLSGYPLAKPLRSGRGAIVTWLRSWLGVMSGKLITSTQIVLDDQVVALPGWMVMWVVRLSPMATVREGLTALEGVS